MAQVALAWVANRPGVSSVLIGASREEQLRKNVTALDIELSTEQKSRLEAVGALPMLNPYFIFGLPRGRIFSGHSVETWEQRRMQTELTGVQQASDPRAMPLGAFVADVIRLLERGEHPGGRNPA
ncbi:aldo/keto reductase [Bradyrhizobium prioriisuperbiae]|uniref:aldo/keto reductase n=1 Tax=Bradyrhizobium prioriisuperbiae TaxID=2854389 RepID=UPI0028F08694|nr:aldo/keto reductase [Bradyrhizobium prioritasuperba]